MFQWKQFGLPLCRICGTAYGEYQVSLWLVRTETHIKECSYFSILYIPTYIIKCREKHVPRVTIFYIDIIWSRKLGASVKVESNYKCVENCPIYDFIKGWLVDLVFHLTFIIGDTHQNSKGRSIGDGVLNNWRISKVIKALEPYFFFDIWQLTCIYPKDR